MSLSSDDQGINQSEGVSLPEWKEVEDYTKSQLSYHLSKYRGRYPSEIIEDISQYCWLEVWKAYSNRMDGEKGWKAFVQRRISGAIKDFLKLGQANEEVKWRAKIKKLQDDDEDGSGQTIASYAISERVTSVESGEGQDFNSSVEMIAGVYGVANTDSINLNRINWDLVSRLASVDDSVLLVAKHLIGDTFEEMSERSNVTRERFSQKFSEFFDRLDSYRSDGDKWCDQVIFAFGLCDVYGTPKIDNGLGWDLEPVDLFSDEIYFEGKKYSPQASMFKLCDSFEAPSKTERPVECDWEAPIIESDCDDDSEQVELFKSDAC